MSLAIYAIFFLSGASALLFETLWFRLAGLTFGNSLWASSLVLSAFMAGLGLGNLWAARYGPRLKRPLLVYAAVEVVIGLAGYSLVLLLPVLTPFLTPLFRPLLEFPVLLHSLRLLFAFVLLLIPSTAMGVTLPLLVKTLSARDSNFGRVLGHLYGWNTLGAVAGALAGELYFIGLLGLRGTGLVAASLNLLAALASGLLARRLASAHEPEAGAPDASLPSWRSGQAVRLLAAAFLSGGLLLALEVVWFRFLLLFALPSSLVFAVMLSVILLGIGAGGLLASLWLGWRPTDYRYTPFLAIAAAALTVFTYILFDDGFGVYPNRPVSEARIVFPLTAGLCVPVSLLSGMIFTFLGRALGDALANETKASAALTFANTTGAMLGPLAAGFVLIPFLGVEWSFFVLGLSYGGVAFLSLGAGAYQKTRTREETILFHLAAVGVALLFVFFPFGLMKNHYIPLITQPLTRDGSRLVAMREGRTETAIYLRRDLWDQPQYYRLVTNSFSMSASHLPSQRYMSLFAYWPAALHPSPKKALLISYGLGVTARALTEIESLESIDIVDISETILELNREVGMFPERHPLDDPRARVRIEDGRFILQTIGTSYDIITGEPPPPKMAGIVNLYTKEYFALLYDRLAPGGLATYWLPVRALNVEETKAIAKAFCSAFADCSLWSGADFDWMLVGSRSEPEPVSDEVFSRPWQSPRSGKGLRAIGVEAPEQLGALFLADASFLNKWTEEVEALEDNYPQRLSSHLPQLESDFNSHVKAYKGVMRVEDAEERFYQSPWIRKFWPEGMRSSARDYFPHQKLLNRHFSAEANTMTDLYEALEGSSLRSLPLLILKISDYELALVDKALEADVVDPGLDYYRASRALADRNYAEAVLHLEDALRLNPQSIELAQYRIFALMLAGQVEAGRLAADELRSRAPSGRGIPGFWDWLVGMETAMPKTAAPSAGH